MPMTNRNTITNILCIIITLCYCILSCDGSSSVTTSSTITSTDTFPTAQWSTSISDISSSNMMYDRQLEIGDFDRINTIFQNSTLQLQDQQISSGQLDLNIMNLQCNQIQIGDITLNYTTQNVDTSPSIISISIAVNPFSMDCTADYSYDFISLTGSGTFLASTQNNIVTTTINIIAPNGFNNEVPSQSEIIDCSSLVNVVDTNFMGGIVSTVLNLFENAVSDVISNQANIAVCNIINELGNTFFSDILNKTKHTFDTWLEPIPDEYNDPLLAERNYIPPDGVTLLSFSDNTTTTDDNTSIGEFVIHAIRNADTLLTGTVNDTSTMSGTDLEINAFIRENFLDDNGIFTFVINNDIVLNNSANTFNPVLYDGVNKLSKIVIRINTVHIGGLDTMTKFNPFIELGQYTFRNELSWDRLSVSFDLTIDIESSPLEDPILINAEPLKVTENITITLDLEKIDVNASLFIAIDQNKFDYLPLGALLKDPVVCFLSALDTMEISGLEVALGQFSEPILDGFVSPGVQRIVATIIEAGFIAYEPTLISIVPYFFQVTVRDIINDDFLVKFLGEENECLSNAQSIPESSIIDFRDLLLPSNEAISLGGSGTAPYGNLMHALYNTLQNEYLSADPMTGLAAINDKFISDFTMDQSGIEGRLFFPGNVLNQTREIHARGKHSTIRLRIFDLYLNNVNTLGVPLTIFEPVNDEPYLVQNEASIGINRTLRFGFRFFLGITNSGMYKLFISS
jgi:hypothetical protein